MPNGSLASHYKSKPLSAGKRPVEDKARFQWSDCSKFELLEGEPRRIRVVYFDEKMDSDYKKKLKIIQKFYDEEQRTLSKK